MPFEIAEKFKVLPIRIGKSDGSDHLEVLTGVALERETLRELQFVAGIGILASLVSCDDIREAIKLAYHGSGERLHDAVRAIPREQRPARPIERAGGTFATKTGVGEFLETLLRYAEAHHASDIHLNPSADGTKLSLRIGGELRHYDTPIGSARSHFEIVNQLKILCALDVTKHRGPQDGSCAVRVGETTVSLRVATLPTVHGERAVVRLLPDDRARTLVDLGFPPEEVREIVTGLSDAEGLVVLCGPTGSGKTTTLYGVMRHLIGAGLCLVSAEDPVEERLQGVSQTQVDEKAGLSYGAVLRAMLRQDPDAIMIGEIRDAESAALAVRAGLTGHLVLTSLHSSSAAQAIARLTNLGIAPADLESSLERIISQRLLRRLCPRCKIPDIAASNAFRAEVFKPFGCEACSMSGYDGVVPICEIATLERPGDGRAGHRLASPWNFDEAVLRRVRAGCIGVEEMERFRRR